MVFKQWNAGTSEALVVKNGDPQRGWMKAGVLEQTWSS